MNSHTIECCIITLSVMGNVVFFMQMTMQVTDLKRFAEADKTDLIYNHFFDNVLVCLVYSLCIRVFDISINFQRLSGYIRIFLFCLVHFTVAPSVLCRKWDCLSYTKNLECCLRHVLQSVFLIDWLRVVFIVIELLTNRLIFSN